MLKKNVAAAELTILQQNLMLGWLKKTKPKQGTEDQETTGVVIMKIFSSVAFWHSATKRAFSLFINEFMSNRTLMENLH